MAMSFIRDRGAWLKTTLCALAAAALLVAAPARAAQCGNDGEGFQGWLAAFKQEAAREGFSPAVIEASLRDVSYDRSVIAHDRKQGIFHRSFEQFSNHLLTPGRIARGRALLRRHAALLQAIERQYGVPGAVLVAIWGLETTYGDDSGNFRTFSALATLAYDCRRSDRFRAELMDALRIVQRGDMSPSQMRGAWAGEIGPAQFMPSSYLKYAVDFNSDGRRDLVHDTADVLASTANFLYGNGWRRGAGWDEGEPNFSALQQWNQAQVYCKTIALFADKLASGADPGADR
jgi:lytic murein transglycosylase